MNTRKVHFINRIEDNNIGDSVSCPYIYFDGFFMNYNIIRHDLLHIDWMEIFQHGFTEQINTRSFGRILKKDKNKSIWHNCFFSTNRNDGRQENGGHLFVHEN